jgi:hypothetical protein
MSPKKSKQPKKSKPRLNPIIIDCIEIPYNGNDESSINLDNDTMMFYLLVAIIHDYLHDVSPNTAVGKDRLIKVIRSLADQKGNPVIKIFGGSGRGDTVTPGNYPPTDNDKIMTQQNVDDNNDDISIEPTNLIDDITEEQQQSPPPQRQPPQLTISTTAPSNDNRQQQEKLTLDEELCRIILGVFGYVQMKITNLTIVDNTNNIVNFLWKEIDAAFEYYIFEVLSIYQTADNIEKDGIIIDLIIVKCLKIYFELLNQIQLPNGNITLPINYFACDETLLFMRHVCEYIYSDLLTNTVPYNPPREILAFISLRVCLKQNIKICKNTSFTIIDIFDCNDFTDDMANVIFNYIDSYIDRINEIPPFNDPQIHITGGYTKKQIGGVGDEYNVLYNNLLFFIQYLTVDESVSVSQAREEIMGVIMKDANTLFQGDDLLKNLQAFLESKLINLKIPPEALENIGTLITNLRTRLNRTPRNANTFIYSLVRILKDFFYTCSGRNFDVQLKNILKEERALKKIASKHEKEESAHVNAAYPGEPQDIKAAWKISQIYARTGLEGLGFVDANGVYTRLVDANGVYTQIAINANPFLKLETQILRKLANYSNPPVNGLLFGKLDGSTIDDKLEDGIIKIFNGDMGQNYKKNRFFYLDENTHINNNKANIIKYYNHWYNTDWRNDNNSSKLEKFFIDNALNKTNLAVIDRMPTVLCNIPTFIDGWNTSGCVATSNGMCKTSIVSEVPQPGQGFYFNIRNNDGFHFYKENVRNFDPATGNFNLELETSLLINGVPFRLDIENANITDTTALCAKYVLRNQINNLNNYFTTYFNKPNLSDLITPPGDLWETFRTDTVPLPGDAVIPMLKFMQYGGRKAIADINIEMSCLYAQNLYYRNVQPAQYQITSPINGNHRPILGGVTDRPSIVRQITLDLMAQEGSAKNCLLWSLYNSPSKRYGAIPSIYNGDYDIDFPGEVFRIHGGGKKYTRNNRKKNHKTYKKNIFKNLKIQKSKKQIKRKIKQTKRN